GTSFAVHGEDFVQSFTVEGELPFVDLLFRLSIRRLPGRGGRPEGEADLVVVVERGLGDGVVRYLWRNRVAARLALVSAAGTSAFEQHRPYLYLRVSALPAR